ncbi:MAG TPA: selenium metabolism-associated LysR family transcriptional regulator [Geobacteraceae bacterium]
MNLKQLEVFVAIAESGSFSRGADLCCITQSTVSQHMAALEDELGLLLFDRVGRGVQLTEAGRVLLRRTKRVLMEVGEIRQTMKRFRGLEIGHLQIGGSNIPGTYMIPPVLGSLLADYPGLTVTVLQGDSRNIAEKVSQGEIELGVVGGCFSLPGLSYSPLGADTLQLVVPAGHPWQGRPTVSPAELAAAPLIMREPGSGTAKTIGEALQQAGLPVGQVLVSAQLGSNEAVKQAVINGLGVSFLSSLSVERELADRVLSAVAVEGVVVVRTLFLVCRTGRDLSPAALAFRAAMVERYGAPLAH